MMKVLVIDDERATLTMFRLFLTAYGYEVLVASDGQTGLAIHEKERPPIVFTDLKMPEIDGFEVLRQIKKRDPTTEVIVITGHGDMDLIVQALNLEAIDFINKPVSRAALDSALKRAEARLQTPAARTPDISLVRKPDAAVVSIRGTLNQDARQRLLRTVEDALGQPVSSIVFDFDHDTAVNGVGITLLTQILSDLRKKNIRTFISGLSENFVAIFETVGISRFAPLCDSAADALGRIAAIR
jgi:FixJ family two-component response regulator